LRAASVAARKKGNQGKIRAKNNAVTTVAARGRPVPFRQVYQAASARYRSDHHPLIRLFIRANFCQPQRGVL
jgi:hypothetical protein